MAALLVQCFFAQAPFAGIHKKVSVCAPHLKKLRYVPLQKERVSFYETKEMLFIHKNENTRATDLEFLGLGFRNVKYIENAEERETYKLHFRDGLLYEANGNLFDTTDANPGNAHEPVAKFVMDKFGNIYAHKFHEGGYFHHSSFLAGAPVAAAGEMKVKNGKLFYISDYSNHYRPGAKFTYQVLEELVRKGVNLRTADINFFVETPQDVLVPVFIEPWMSTVSIILFAIQLSNDLDYSVLKIKDDFMRSGKSFSGLIEDLNRALTSDLSIFHMAYNENYSEEEIRTFLKNLRDSIQ